MIIGLWNGFEMCGFMHAILSKRRVLLKISSQICEFISIKNSSIYTSSWQKKVPT